jgi:circadian clock protein KaiC
MGSTQSSATESFLSTGISGLDYILRGGLTRDRLYLVEGSPGSGKTTLALQFLVEGSKRGEPVLYITLSETAIELKAVATSHGWSIEGLRIHEVLPSESILNPDEQYSVFHPSDVEMGSTTKEIISIVEQLKPNRVVLDSLSELQLLSSSPLMHRRQVLAFKQFFASRSCTTLLLDDLTANDGDLQVLSIAHGVISLERLATDYGGLRRRLQVRKYRGVEFREGSHDYKIQRGGLVVYPRLIASETRHHLPGAQFSSGMAELDALLGGGFEEGTSTLLAGPPGTGKSSLSAQIMSTCLQRQLRGAIFLFEESASNYLNRANALGFGFKQHLESGNLALHQIDPAQLTPGEFIKTVCHAADSGAKLIIIDSLNGFLHAMPNERLLTTHLHEMLTYLGQCGGFTLLIGVQQGLLGSHMSTQVDASYLADNIILLRYFEASGAVRQAISVFKKRGSSHERTIREMTVTSTGINIGPVLKQFRGILTGVPELMENPIQQQGGQDGGL